MLFIIRICTRYINSKDIQGYVTVGHPIQFQQQRIRDYVMQLRAQWYSAVVQGSVDVIVKVMQTA